MVFGVELKWRRMKNNENDSSSKPEYPNTEYSGDGVERTSEWGYFRVYVKQIAQNTETI